MHVFTAIILTYLPPAQSELSDARLREVLSVLDLQYLLDKPEYLTDESACQRLCVALCVNTRC